MKKQNWGLADLIFVEDILCSNDKKIENRVKCRQLLSYNQSNEKNWKMTVLQNMSAKCDNSICAPSSKSFLWVSSLFLLKSNKTHPKLLCCVVVALIVMGSIYLDHSQLGYIFSTDCIQVKQEVGALPIGGCHLNQTPTFLSFYHFIPWGQVTPQT